MYGFVEVIRAIGFGRYDLFNVISIFIYQTLTCLKSIIETLDEDVKCVQS